MLLTLLRNSVAVLFAIGIVATILSTRAEAASPPMQHPLALHR
jgi:hypothetical protein